MPALPAGPRRGGPRASQFEFNMSSWSLDDRFIITTQFRLGQDGAPGEQRTKVWDARTGTLLHILLAHSMEVRGLTASLILCHVLLNAPPCRWWSWSRIPLTPASS